MKNIRTQFRCKPEYFFRLTFVCALFFFLFYSSAHAHNSRVSIIIPNDSPQYTDLISSISSSAAINNKREALNVINLSKIQQNTNMNLNDEQLVVLVGSKAFDYYTNRKAKSPYITTFITKSAFNFIYNKADKSKFVGGISVDQPEQRYIKLTKALIPSLKQLALIYGPERSRKNKAVVKNVKSNIVNITLNDNPVNKLRNAFEINQALILFPDRKNFNRSLSRWVLTLSYQYKIPVISYSKKYATAGALASLFSTPEKIGIQTAEMMLSYLNNANYQVKRLLDPQYFDIEINVSVANALNIRTPSISKLRQKITP